MTSRTLLSIVLGIACSALAVGGLYWAGGREAAADPSLDRSAEARAAYEAGQAPVAEPRLREPEPAPTRELEIVEAAGGDPAPAAEPAYENEDEGEGTSDREYDDDDDHGEEHGDDDDEGEDD